MASRFRGAAAASLAALAAAVTVPAFTAPATSLVLASAAATVACTGNDCVSDTQSWGSCTQGDRLDADTWESTPLTGTDWLDLHGERTWVLDPSPWMGAREPIGVAADVSLEPRPVDDGGAAGTGASGPVCAAGADGGVGFGDGSGEHGERKGGEGDCFHELCLRSLFQVAQYVELRECADRRDSPHLRRRPSQIP